MNIHPYRTSNLARLLRSPIVGICLGVVACSSLSIAIAQTSAPTSATPPSSTPAAPQAVTTPSTPSQDPQASSPPPAASAPASRPQASQPIPPSPSPEVASTSTQSEKRLKLLTQEETQWTSTQPILTLHGFFRTRGEIHDSFSLGRITPPTSSTGDPPFDAFRPIDSASVTGGCEGDGTGAGCGGDSSNFVNMRFRLIPTLTISDNVRIKMWVDMLDNVILGSNPDSVGTSQSLPMDAFNSTAMPATRDRNSFTDSIVVRRAWAEVRDRDIGELRFGRMGFHWGLGMRFNDGSDFDGDYSTDVDRLLGITKVSGVHLMAAYDMTAKGVIRRNGYNIPYDAGQHDDVSQWMLAALKKEMPDKQTDILKSGGWVLNGGFMFLHRSQQLSSKVSNSTNLITDSAVSGATTESVYRGMSVFTPDLWAQFLYKSLRLELEGTFNAGSIDNIQVNGFNKRSYSIFQLGMALESEYRLLNDKLGLYFYTGLATGDSDIDGLSSMGNSPGDNLYNPARASDGNLSAFAFHPNYRIDLILWRNIMQRVSSAYYFRPGISYDLIRSAYGKLLGGRLDVVWSRAASTRQTYGQAADLGIELDAQLYFRSEDGPELFDGFQASLQYGVLFPLSGLGYAPGQFPANTPDLSNAQIVRLLLGIVF